MTDTFTATRDQLVDAIACIELRIPQSGPMARKIPAEQMADAIITVLARDGAETAATRFVTVSREDIRAVVRLARLSRHLAEDPATDRLAAAAGEGTAP